MGHGIWWLLSWWVIGSSDFMFFFGGGFHGGLMGFNQQMQTLCLEIVVDIRFDHDFIGVQHGSTMISLANIGILSGWWVGG